MEWNDWNSLQKGDKQESKFKAIFTRTYFDQRKSYDRIRVKITFMSMQSP